MTRTIRSEQDKLLHHINLMSFVIVEMTLYLDTHPYDSEAIDYLKHYVRMKDKAMKEYAAQFGPLTIDTADSANGKEWQWALSAMPWEGGCN